MDDSDKKWIDENVMNNLVPLQYSIKLDSGEIYVIQTETIEELKAKIEELKATFFNSRTIPEPPMPTTVTTPSGFPQPTGTLICSVCGGGAEIKEGTSKAGNHYKIFRCLKFPELTDKGGHSRFTK